MDFERKTTDFYNLQENKSPVSLGAGASVLESSKGGFMNLLGRLVRKEGLYTDPRAGIISLFLCKEVMVGKMSLFHSVRLIAVGFKFLQDLSFLLSTV